MAASMNDRTKNDRAGRDIGLTLMQDLASAMWLIGQMHPAPRRLCLFSSSTEGLGLKKLIDPDDIAGCVHLLIPTGSHLA
jgi:hypothetical protein